MADVASISNTAPIWAALIGITCLQQPCKFSIGVSLVTAPLGMVLITQPNWLFKGEDNLPVLSLVASITAAVVAGATELLIQRVKEDQWVLTWYAGVFQVILGGISVFTLQTHTPIWPAITPLVWVCFLLVPLCGTGNQVFRTMALRMTKDVNVLLMRYGVTIFCCIWDSLILHRPIRPWSLCGIVVLLLTGAYMVIDKQNAAKATNGS